MTNRFRKRIRLSDWDYSQSTIYMVTICIADRTHRLGTMTESNQVTLSDAGRMVTQEIQSLPEQFPNVYLDEYVVMPNHFHVLLGLGVRKPDSPATSLGSVIGSFKSRSTNRYIKGVRMGVLPEFDRHLWQRDYYETIMRDDNWVGQRREYIMNNPANWREDPEMDLGDMSARVTHKG